MPLIADDARVVQIMHEFDFERVQRTMRALNWEWSNSIEGEKSVPGLEKLKKKARELLSFVCSSDIDTTSVASGGLQAYKSVAGLGLRFIVEDRWEEGPE